MQPWRWAGWASTTPRALAPYVSEFADLFIDAMGEVEPTEDKVTAFTGFAMVVGMNPRAIGMRQSSASSKLLRDTKNSLASVIRLSNGFTRCSRVYDTMFFFSFPRPYRHAEPQANRVCTDFVAIRPDLTLGISRGSGKTGSAGPRGAPEQLHHLKSMADRAVLKLNRLWTG